MNAQESLFAAIQSGDAATVEAMLKAEPALVHGANADGLAPVMVATYYRQEGIARTLIEQGAAVDVFAAAARGDTDRLAALLAEQAELAQAYSPDGWTALALAAHFGHPRAVEILLDRGADLHARSQNGGGNTPLHAALAGRQLATASLLLERGADVNAADANGWAPLHLAAQSGNLALVELVLAHRPFVDPENEQGVTPLALARAEGHQAVVELLERHSADQLQDANPLPSSGG